MLNYHNPSYRKIARGSRIVYKLSRCGDGEGLAEGLRLPLDGEQVVLADRLIAAVVHPVGDGETVSGEEKSSKLPPNWDVVSRLAKYQL